MAGVGPPAFVLAAGHGPPFLRTQGAQAPQPSTQVNFLIKDVSFTFNIGINAFRGSTLLRVLNQGHNAEVPAQMMRWTMGGLDSRRRDEVRLWKYGQYT